VFLSFMTCHLDLSFVAFCKCSVTLMQLRSLLSLPHVPRQGRSHRRVLSPPCDDTGACTRARSWPLRLRGGNTGDVGGSVNPLAPEIGTLRNKTQREAAQQGTGLPEENLLGRVDRMDWFMQGRAYLLLFVSVGALVFLMATLAGTTIAVLHQDLSSLLKSLMDEEEAVDSEEPGFSTISSQSWARFGQRAGKFFSFTRAAAALGWRSAANRLKDRGWLEEGIARWLRGARPVVYLVLGYMFSQWLALCAQQRVTGKYKIDHMTANFLQTVVKYSVLALGLTYVLKALGVPAQGLDALLASSGIAAGIASQKILQNLASGVVLLIFRPFKIGDKIALPGRGVEGWVTEVRLFETKLITDDRRTLWLPNAEIYDKHIENLTTAGMRRVHIDVFVAGSVSVASTREAIMEAISPFEYLARLEKRVKARQEADQRRSSSPAAHPQRLVQTQEDAGESKTDAREQALTNKKGWCGVGSGARAVVRIDGEVGVEGSGVRGEGCGLRVEALTVRIIRDG
jgi:small conductance mechanosensitive channel